MSSKSLDNQPQWLGHPVGLFILFFTELWERFSYYGMRALLVLYIYSSIEDGGLGWTRKEALELYGWYTMLVYVASIPGGILADRLLGQKRAVMLGGILLCIGHMVLAVEALWAFYAGLGLIILGVGCLKPNISTMVGGLYKQGDDRRDKGFIIFYIGINIGAFLSALIVGYVGEKIGWHYGFGLAGLGMILGQIVYVWGQKYLVGVGDFLGSKNSVDKEAMNRPLTKIEKDRVIVLILSFIIIVVFWGAFEQAGGLLNIYANEKIDLTLDAFNWKVPASWFQSVNAFFIITFGTAVAAFWAWRKRQGKEVSSLFKMGVGTIVMGLGFLLMAGASVEAGGEAYGKAAMIWLIGAYLLHTLGELCVSPVALSFITKLAPIKYASIMMGVYFAATGFGNKLAGSIGEAAQPESIEVAFVASAADVDGLNLDPSLNSDYTLIDSLVDNDKNFALRARIEQDASGELHFYNYEAQNDQDFLEFVEIGPEAMTTLKNTIAQGEEGEQLHATLKFEKDVEAKKIKANKGDVKNYGGEIVVEEVQNRREFNIFLFITGLTVIFGLLIILFLRKLKALTHGAEEIELEGGGH
ncbi:MAG: peptide MFS transporter [Bacteroidota bacterium]